MKKMTRNEFLKMIGSGVALFAITTVLAPSTFAANPNPVIIKDVNKVIQNPLPLSFYGIKPEIVPFSNELSEVKTQTKKAYLSIAGDYLGTVTLQYQIIIAGGRPQFAYDTVKLGYDFTSSTSYYSIGSPSVDFTGDKITVYFPAQFGLLIDEAIVEFTPY